MRFGLMYHVEQYGGSAADVLGEVIESALLADELGFDEIWLAEHHFHVQRSFLPSPLILASYLAARTERIRLGTAIIVLPIHHPIDIAEQAALVDVLSGGRLTIGFGTGAGEREFIPFGASYQDRHDRFREAVEVVMRAWSDETVSYQGEHFQIPETRVEPKPLQRPEDLAWIGAMGITTSRVAGEMGVGLMLPRGLKPERYHEPIAAYREAFGGPGRISIARNIFVGRTAAEAREIGVAALRQFCQRWRAKDVDCDMPADELIDRLQFVIGDVDDCVEQLRALHTATGLSFLSIQPSWDGVPHDAELRSIELLGREVLPQLRDL